MKTLKVQSLTLVLCILCSVCVVPAMAADKQDKVTEDGVHLIKFDDSPTILDYKYYDMEPSVNFVVDGNQFYWVRIGSERAEKLSSNDIAKYLCYGCFAAIMAGVGSGVTSGALATAPETLGGSLVLYYLGIGTALAVAEGATTWTASKLCPWVEKLVVANNYRYVASDGTILIGISKNNTAGIQELKKDGIDIGNLRHLKKDGSVADNRKTDL